MTDLHDLADDEAAHETDHMPLTSDLMNTPSGQSLNLTSLSTGLFAYPNVAATWHISLSTPQDETAGYQSPVEDGDDDASVEGQAAELDEYDDDDDGFIQDYLVGAQIGGMTEDQQAIFFGPLSPPSVHDLIEPEDMVADNDDPLLLPPREATPEPPQIPSDEGMILMHSGAFGINAKSSLAKLSPGRRLLNRELGIRATASARADHRCLTQVLLPETRADAVIHYDEPVYGGQFSDDGTFFFSFCQDLKVRMYDTSNPYNWRHYKTVKYPYAGWTLTDACLSPDNDWLVYSSLNNIVCLSSTDPSNKSPPQNLEFPARGIFSIRVSRDSREIVAGTNARSVVVFDVETGTALHNIRGHDKDVNAVAFADKSAPHLIYSGSDDCLIKIWDRRSMASGRPAGGFVGHCEGITYVESKQDGRYMLSNSKDQSMKLWDLRKAMSAQGLADNASLLRAHARHYPRPFDYRMDEFDVDSCKPHPLDVSLVTFRGHRVLRSLIRCHFSPPNSSDSRYVYSGSADGKIRIWNLDSTIARTVDVRAATHNRGPDAHTNFFHWTTGAIPERWSTCVRDASWHPYAPVLVASSWSGYGLGGGSCSIHSYHDAHEDEDEAIPNMGKDVKHNLKPL